jgi:hypothetical protein
MGIYTWPPNQVYLASQPIMYNKDRVPVQVGTDSVTPNLSKPLPTQLLFKKDGDWVFANYDTVTPSNSEAIPVNIVTVNGQGISTTVDLTGAQINVQLSHNGTTPDSIRVGDGTNLLGINANNEAKVRDADSIAELVLIKGHVDGIEGKLDGLQTTLSSIDVNISDIETLVTSTNTKIDTLNGKDFATQTTLAALLTELQLKADLLETQPVSIQNASIAVTGPLTDAQLRATSVPVSGPITDSQLRAAAVPTQEVSADGITPFASQAINRTAQKTISTIGTDFLAKAVAAITIGFDGDEHREISVDSTGKVNIAASQLPSSLGTKTAANSVSVTPASDAIYTTTETPNGTSTDNSQDGDHTTGATFTKPANAKKMVIFNNADATVANRIRFGSAPNWTTRQGAILGVGASTALLPAATFIALAEDSSSQANVSVIYFY